ncbi:hypothetical protein HMPREF9081_0536 [Centipeda periodontii DSM 2778]|uniref:Uncharacterized protein n=1 Tax=Centipeda periodontii DSM 2778 TaxID=888060 RepID=F5RJW5_9FIRM|nr:hypothetical protein HMPREF9081_0536 [Centipeda periodontii DSM 2778]
MPFCISILTSVRRIVKIAVRFLHTKTALCDRKDTQSRFAVNTARSIVCVGTTLVERRSSMRRCFNAARGIMCVGTASVVTSEYMEHLFQCRTRHYVCRDLYKAADILKGMNVSMPHAALCVSGLHRSGSRWESDPLFQCRTQHCVCRDRILMQSFIEEVSFNAARSIVCVGTLCPSALVPRGLHRFGKSKRRYAALRPCRSTLHFLLLYDSIRFVLFQ